MAIITISRGLLSGGEHIAKMVADELQHECISREMLVDEAASTYGLDAQSLMENLENPPTLWERLTGGRRVYLSMLHAVLLERALDNNIVYHGFAGHFFLQEIPCALKTRFVVGPDKRIQTAMETQQMNRSDAERYIIQADEFRARWTKFLYGVEWGDPLSFDLILNLDNMSFETARDMICALSREKEYQLCDECKKSLADMVLTAKVHAHFVMNKETETLDIDVAAQDGTIILSGKIESAGLRKTVFDVVRSVPGVKNVQDETVVQKTSPIPT